MDVVKDFSRPAKRLNSAIEWLHLILGSFIFFSVILVEKIPQYLG